MSYLKKRLKKRYDLTLNLWKSDCHFSKKFAMIRVLDDFSHRLGTVGFSKRMHQKKDKYILDYLKNRLIPVIDKYKDIDDVGECPDNTPIWVCWWTGKDSAPPIVKQCMKSIYHNAGNHEVHFISEDTYRDYIDIPDYIMERMNKGQMGLAHFADYIRVSLLQKYGGLWLDATIFCSGEIPEEYFSLPFFTLKSSYRESRYISNYQWVTFCLGGWKENVFYSFLKEAFECYWKHENVAIDYLFFDYMICLAKESIPAIGKYMDSVPENTPHRDDLQRAMNEALPAEVFWNVIKDDTTLYKLSWREKYSEKTSDGSKSVYGYFISDLKMEDF